MEFGPEGAAWVARMEAEHLRWRWAAQLDPPGQDDLVAAWRRAEELAEAYGNVPDLARLRVRLSSVLRGVGDAVGARAASDGARATAHDLGAQPLLDELVLLGSAAVPQLRTGRRLAHRARARDPRARRRGPLQRRDRPAAVHQHQDRVGPRLQHPEQAGGLRPHGGGRARPAPGAARLTAAMGRVWAAGRSRAHWRGDRRLPLLRREPGRRRADRGLGSGRHPLAVRRGPGSVGTQGGARRAGCPRRCAGGWRAWTACGCS